MKKPKKVKEPLSSGLRYCSRCGQSYCWDCIEFKEVDFEVLDISENNNNKIQWKDFNVCIWCYNQLIDVAFPQTQAKS